MPKLLSTAEVAEVLETTYEATVKALSRSDTEIQEIVGTTNYYKLSDIKALKKLRAKRVASRRTGPRSGNKKQSHA